MTWTQADEKVLRDLQRKRNASLEPLQHWLLTAARPPRRGDVVPGQPPVDTESIYAECAAHRIFDAAVARPEELVALLRELCP